MRFPSLAVFTVVTVLLTGCAESPEAAVKTFYKAVDKGEITQARHYLSSQLVSLLGERKLSAALVRFAERVSKCGGFKSVEVTLTGQGEIRSGTARAFY